MIKSRGIMRKRVLGLILILLFACELPLDQRTVARFSNQEIKVRELKRKMQEQKSGYSLEILHDPAGSLIVKKRLLNDLIEEKILLSFIEKSKTTLSDSEEKEWREKVDSGYMESELQNILQKKKMTLEEWRKRQKEKALIDKFIHEEMKPQIEISEKELTDYYKKHQSDFKEKDRVHCRQIVTSKEEKATKILSLLNKGENFSSLAKQYSESPDASEGGDLGYVAAGDSPDVFVQACFTLSTGQTSRVVKSEYGYHIFKVIEKKPGRTVSFKEAQQKIRDILFEEKIQLRFKQWMADSYSNPPIAPITIEEETLKQISWDNL